MYWTWSSQTSHPADSYSLCNTLQFTATHCNALQHTATHCNTLQLTATHCNKQMCRTCFKQVALLIHIHSATLCNSLQHTATHCNTLQHTDVPNVFQASRPTDTLYGCPAGRIHLSISINLHISSQPIIYIWMSPIPIYEWVEWAHYLYMNESCRIWMSYEWVLSHMD